MISHNFRYYVYIINLIFTSLHLAVAYIHTDNNITYNYTLPPYIVEVRSEWRMQCTITSKGKVDAFGIGNGTTKSWVYYHMYQKLTKFFDRSLRKRASITPSGNQRGMALTVHNASCRDTGVYWWIPYVNNKKSPSRPAEAPGIRPTIVIESIEPLNITVFLPGCASPLTQKQCSVCDKTRSKNMRKIGYRYNFSCGGELPYLGKNTISFHWYKIDASGKRSSLRNMSATLHNVPGQKDYEMAITRFSEFEKTNPNKYSWGEKCSPQVTATTTLSYTFTKEDIGYMTLKCEANIKYHDYEKTITQFSTLCVIGTKLQPSTTEDTGSSTNFVITRTNPRPRTTKDTSSSTNFSLRTTKPPSPTTKETTKRPPPTTKETKPRSPSTKETVSYPSSVPTESKTPTTKDTGSYTSFVSSESKTHTTTAPGVKTTDDSSKIDFGTIKDVFLRIEPNVVKKDSFVFITCLYKYVNFSNKRHLPNISIGFHIGNVIQFDRELECTKTPIKQKSPPWYTKKVKCRSTCQMSTNVLCTSHVGNKRSTTDEKRLLVYDSLPVDTPEIFTDFCRAKDHNNCEPCTNASGNASSNAAPLTLKHGEVLPLQCQTRVPVLHPWESEPVAKVTWWRFFPNGRSVKIDTEYVFYDWHDLPPANKCINDKSPKIDVISVIFFVAYDNPNNSLTVYCSVTLNVTKKKTISKNSEPITICILPGAPIGPYERADKATVRNTLILLTLVGAVVSVLGIMGFMKTSRGRKNRGPRIYKFQKQADDVQKVADGADLKGRKVSVKRPSAKIPPPAIKEEPNDSKKDPSVKLPPPLSNKDPNTSKKVPSAKIPPAITEEPNTSKNVPSAKIPPPAITEDPNTSKKVPSAKIPPPAITEEPNTSKNVPSAKIPPPAITEEPNTSKKVPSAKIPPPAITKKPKNSKKVPSAKIPPPAIKEEPKNSKKRPSAKIPPSATNQGSKNAKKPAPGKKRPPPSKKAPKKSGKACYR